MRRVVAVAVQLALVITPACHGGTGSARGAAESFLDQHYVHIDLEAAKRYCVGVALEKVQEEQRLVGDQQIDASTRKPHVSYSLAEQRDEADDRVALVYDASIRFDDGGTTALRWLITTRREPDGAWKVSNYQEFQ
jgi:hypothetical protein